jgi:restriction system protein
MPGINKERVGQIVKEALEVLAENEGHLPTRDVIQKTEKKLKLTEYERAVYEKSGYIRWQSVLHFYSIDCVKAGWLRKHKGVWYLTDEGRQALKLDPLSLIQSATEKYKEWRQSQPEPQLEEVGEPTGEPAIARKTAFEQAVSMARAEIEDHIHSLGPYEFQDLVAALLRGMGYYTPFIAAPGKDLGVDILAYKDPFGSTAPRVKVQVKHRRNQKVTAKEVRELVSLLAKEGDAGLIVSSGGFTADAEVEIRRSARHVEKVDLNDLITLWDDHYDRMKEEDRAYLPLRRVPFLAPRD